MHEVQAGRRFDEATGEPESWQTPLAEARVHGWSRRWLGEQWRGSNWARAWHRALESVGQRPMRIYDCRHAAATTWLRAGMPLAETARRLGHSVETLVSTYVGALDDEEHVANQRVDTILG